MRKKDVKQQIDELQPLFEESVKSYHYGGKGKNRKITFIRKDGETVIFDIYEQIRTDNPLEPIKNELDSSLSLFEYILEIAQVPSYLRPLARMGAKFMPGYNGDIKAVSESGQKGIYDMFEMEGIESVTLFHKDGNLEGFAKNTNGEKIPYNFIEKMNELITQSV